MNVLWIPIFSMRSYETGKYAITKDGNFQLTLSRIAASDFDSITVAIPHEVSDMDMFTKMITKSLGDKLDKVQFIGFNYGENAVETRDLFWAMNDSFFQYHMGMFDLVVTDITGFHTVNHRGIKFINNFNITKLPELNRPYIDRFFEMDLASIRAAEITTVINPRQREYILEVDPSLADKVIAYTKVASEHFLPKSEKPSHFLPLRSIFWPFRISDSAYKFDKFVEMFVEQKLDKRWKIVITDPNDSYKGDHKFVTKTKLSKDDYYSFLQSRPIVVMLDEIDTVLHPGTIEFFYYGCPVITLLNDLVGNKYQVESISDIPDMLSEVTYNAEIGIDNFVYSLNEVSKVYSVSNKALQ